MKTFILMFMLVSFENSYDDAVCITTEPVASPTFVFKTQGDCEFAMLNSEDIITDMEKFYKKEIIAVCMGMR